ncbi:RiPP maturation radical SAM C-methyltransferase [Teredinibacter purpureus]|uniref:RiPP maturation radical SAM C-methyltransferase n=1 Tax=Teredinibacter purpureus TaxID=2731756 RepID=UPI0005F7CA5F|nr:RiPP maturation radical SAM C-methyltransferase [Teredinibacter purpureus]
MIQSAEQETTLAQVALVSMPFGLPYMPSLGLSLLKSGLRQRHINADLHYLNLEFTQAIGYTFYQRIAHGGASHLGDWIFYRALYGEPSQELTDTFWRLAFPDNKPRNMAADFPSLQDTVATAQFAAEQFVERQLECVNWSQYRIVGFTSMFQQNIAALSLARRIKERHPTIQLVFGGPNVESDMGLALMRCFPFIDYVFSGEADTTFPQFITALLEDETTLDETLHQFAGVGSRHAIGNRVKPPKKTGDFINDMDSLPYPDFDDFFNAFNLYFPSLKPHLNYETARGCWWGAKSHCTFCGLNGLTMAFRSKSPQRALDEIAYLHDKYMKPQGVLLMQPADQILDLQYFGTLIPQLADIAPNIPTFFETKANLNKSQVYELANAGVQILQPGIESLNSRILTLMGKGCTLLQNVQLLKWCSQYGIYPIWNMLYGFPGETHEDYQQCSALVPLILHLQHPKKYFAIELDRFSPYFNRPENYQLGNIRPPEIMQIMYPFSQQNQHDLCYTFDFDYHEKGSDGEPRTAQSFLGDSLERVAQQWMNTRQRGALLGFTTQDSVLIYDSRPDARNQWLTVKGLFKQLLLEADKIVTVTRLAEFANSHAPETELGSDERVAEFLTCMHSHGLIIQEKQRLISLVVLQTDTETPSMASLAPHASTTLVEQRNLARAQTHSEQQAWHHAAPSPTKEIARDYVVLNIDFERFFDAQAGTCDVQGICVVESFWGTTSYRLQGQLYKTGQKHRMEATLERLSGFASGSCSLSVDITSNTSGELQYNDGANNTLILNATHCHIDNQRYNIQAQGCGFRYASFLASGESLGGAEAIN